MMKVFNAVARVVAVFMTAVVIRVAYWKAGWAGVACVICGAAVVAMLWSASPADENRGGEAALQVTIEDEEHCRTRFNGSIADIALYAPAAIASVCIGVEHASDGILTRDKMIEVAQMILDDESECVKIMSTKKVKRD